MSFSKPFAFRLVLGACTSTIAIASLWAGNASAQSAGVTTLEGIVIEGDSRGTDVDAEKVGTAVTVITGEELQQRGITYVSEALRSVPGVSISRSGPFGGLTQARIRGAEGNHTLVIIDGIEVSDPGQGEFDLSTLVTENIERIEVLRGAQSALWGSNATAGVINIITKKAEPGARVGIKAEGGSFGTKLLSGYASAANTWARGIVSASGLDTDGYSSSPYGDEDDEYDNRTISFKGDADVLPFLNIDGVVRKTRTRAQFDPQDFSDSGPPFFTPGPNYGLVVDGDRSSAVDQLFAATRATLSTFDGHWKHSVFFNRTDYETEGFADQVRNSGNKGTRDSFGYQTTVQFNTPSIANAKHTIVGLIEEETETFRNTGPFDTPAQRDKKERTLQGHVAEYRLELFDSLFLTGAYRFDKNDAFDDAETYRFTAAYLLAQTGTRFHGSYGKGVTNPTFVEQFGFFPDQFIGNPNLVPEESISWDVGIEQSFFNKALLVDVTYFRAKLKNEIDTIFPAPSFLATPINLEDESTREGIEITVTARPTDNLDIVATYTHLDAYQTRGALTAREIRRPEHQASLNATYRFSERARTTVSAVYNGEAYDSSFVPSVPSPVLLDGYTLVTVVGEYDLSDQLTAFARVENVLNEDYQEVFGYETAEIAAYAGVRMRFGD
ncbi:TonB-dependent receptor [Hyphomicrobium sp.]|uniref:TonB-dependent receptor plug domain-containing protein n=1 Tax=Hyphomicrobium sp. TaxID=82 RepID=UPI0025C27E18|nr:TonB-dependent receptor [Hyphomicrobium sp.]MCC7250619.1 TonB-dependent receptor [Hyphomicrobium sp.]